MEFPNERRSMNIKNIANNLKRIRNVKGFKQEELATKAGLSRVAYSSIESAKSEPRVSNLQRLADALGVSIEELIKPIPHVSSLRFRSKKMLNTKENCKREQIVMDIAYWLNDFNYLENELSHKRIFKLKDCQGNTPEEMAKSARKKLNLKEDEAINDICGLLENAGIKIKLIVCELNNFFGLSAFDKEGNPAVVVNVSDEVSVERQIFTAAHELGHILLHKNSYIPTEVKEPQQQEEEADQFASYFLMPRDAFQKSWDENKGLHWVDNVLHIKRIYKISYRSVLKRLIEQGVSDQIYMKFYQLYKIKFGKDLKNNREPFPLEKIDFIEDRLSKLVRESYEKELISFNRAAEILKIDNESMRERVNSWEWKVLNDIV